MMVSLSLSIVSRSESVSLKEFHPRSPPCRDKRTGNRNFHTIILGILFDCPQCLVSGRARAGRAAGTTLLPQMAAVSPSDKTHVRDHRSPCDSDISLMSYVIFSHCWQTPGRPRHQTAGVGRGEWDSLLAGGKLLELRLGRWRHLQDTPGLRPLWN